jgi:hypothetical protein
MDQIPKLTLRHSRSGVDLEFLLNLVLECTLAIWLKQKYRDVVIAPAQPENPDFVKA